VVCKHWGVEYADVLSRSRKRKLFFVRMMLAKFLRDYTTYTLTSIGGFVGRDHSTILYYLRNYESEFYFNDEFRTFAKSIQDELDKEDKSDLMLELEDELNEIIG
jgi:chromosomal replication initiation ATPase DnaA